MSKVPLRENGSKSSEETDEDFSVILSLEKISTLSQEEKKPSVESDFEYNHPFSRKEKKLARETTKKSSCISWKSEGEPSTILAPKKTSTVSQKKENSSLIKLDVNISNVDSKRAKKIVSKKFSKNLPVVQWGDDYTIYREENGNLLMTTRIKCFPVDKRISILDSISMDRNYTLYENLLNDIINISNKLFEDRYMRKKLSKLCDVFNKYKPNVGKPEEMYYFMKNEFVEICNDIISTKWSKFKGVAPVEIMGRKKPLMLLRKKYSGSCSSALSIDDDIFDYYEFVRILINQRIENANLNSIDDAYNVKHSLFTEIDNMRRDIIHKTIAFFGVVNKGLYEGKYVVLMESEGRTAKLMLV